MLLQQTDGLVCQAAQTGWVSSCYYTGFHEYKLAVMVRRCLENKAPRYLVNCCTPVADVASWHRRSANLHRLIVPRHRRSTLGRRPFSVRSPTVWNLLPVELREATLSCGAHCSRDTSTSNVIETLCVKLRYINSFWHYNGVIKNIMKTSWIRYTFYGARYLSHCCALFFSKTFFL